MIVILAAVAVWLVTVPAVPVLIVADEQRELVLPLYEGETYEFSYTSSIYGARVDEGHVRAGDAVRVVGVTSPDIRAVEYFRWEGEPGRVGRTYQQAAPPNTQEMLLIRVTPSSGQQLTSARWQVDLGRDFAGSQVRLAPRRLALLDALVRGWRP